MHKNQMIQTLHAGHKITHVLFDPEEWMKLGEAHNIEFEDGCKCTFEQFWQGRTSTNWDSGWSIWNPAADPRNLEPHPNW